MRVDLPAPELPTKREHLSFKKLKSSPILSPFFAEQRDKLIERFGDGWQYFHGIIDYLWVIVVVLGFIFSPHRVAHLIVFTIFWSAALFGIYVPMWVKNNAKPL